MFLESSNSAFGTVAFFSFVLSKSRVAIANSKPSIPRLELYATVMATRLKVSLLEEIKESIRKIFLCSD